MPDLRSRGITASAITSLSSQPKVWRRSKGLTQSATSRRAKTDVVEIRTSVTAAILLEAEAEMRWWRHSKAYMTSVMCYCPGETPHFSALPCYLDVRRLILRYDIDVGLILQELSHSWTNHITIRSAPAGSSDHPFELKQEIRGGADPNLKDESNLR